MSVSERIRIAVLAADKSRRAAISRVLASPFLRWRYGAAGAAGQLVIVPPSLRTADPSFWREIEIGHFGLAGTMAPLKGRSPFDIVPPNPGWARALHGFDWLRHLDAANHPDARETARRLTMEWIERQRGHDGMAWEAAVSARRLISWLSHAGLLLDGADAPTYETITASLGSQLVHLSASWRDSPEGYPRLISLIAVVLADLAISGHDSQLEDAERALGGELSRQILADGGHISRHPGVLVDIMLDLLPLRQCFAARSRKLPDAVATALARIPAMLRFLRLGDGSLARFNGMAVGSPAGLATVLAYDDRQAAQPGLAPQSRYARLSRGSTVLIMDAGPPPPLEASAEAHAGCLSFELSSETRAIFVNGGAPGPSDAVWRALARATASHNTLCLCETSSSELVRNRKLEELAGAPGIRGPAHVEVRVADGDFDALEAVGWHDGYRERFGLVHTRRLVLAQDGRRLTGSDRIAGAKVRVRLRQDLPFAIHFHLHADVECQRGEEAGSAEIRLKDGKHWRFKAEGAVLSVEDSTHFADSAGPRRSLQIVLRASTFGESEVNWTFEAVTP